MAIQAFMFAQADKPERFSIATPITRQSIPATQRPLALVVRNSELEAFRQCKDLFIDRGVKNEAKALPSLLLGYKGLIPVIDGNYSSSGRLQQGIRALLAKAHEVGEAKAYVIGVEEQLLREIGNEKENLDMHRPAGATTSEYPLALKEWPVPEELAMRFLGDTIEYRFVRQMILRAVDSELTVLILGETGSGKNVIARAIHDLGKNHHEHFVEVNCGAIPSELLESELFGHVKGAFTGATTTKAGLWEFVGRGTLFLDEIGDLSLHHQAKVLHALQDRKIRRLGGTAEIDVQARIVAATNHNLFAMTKTKQFREDLYYRLRQIVIHAPVLRSDPADIARLADAQWKKLRGTGATLSRDVLKELCAMRWPGNVRDLNSFLSTLASFYKSEDLRVDHVRGLQRYYAGPSEGYVIDTEDPSYHRIECLRHLRRADEVVHACEMVLKPLADGQSLNKQERTSLEQTRAEMQILLRDRLYFHSQETYDAVARLDSDINDLLLVPEHDARPQVRFWNGTLEPDLHRATGRIFSEVQQLLGEG